MSKKIGTIENHTSGDRTNEDCTGGGPPALRTVIYCGLMALQ